MNNTDLPPLPPLEAFGPEVCATIRLYLAVFQDLSAEQQRIVATHAQICQNCAREQHLVRRATQLVAGLHTSSPSMHVDQAVMAAIAARGRNAAFNNRQASQPMRPLKLHTIRQRRSPVRLSSLVAIAAALLLAILATLHFVLPSSTAFALPANLSWNGYVLYHSQTAMSTQGHPYRINTYLDFTDDSMNVETVMDNVVHVVAVSDGQKTLGMDMMHHVAQWNADTWMTDESTFDLNQLRHDLQAKRASYLGTQQFQGQEVYRIRGSNSQVLLLNMQYQPVNVLSSPNTNQPMYDILWLKPSKQIPSSMWDMSVPHGFTMGNLPARP